MLRALTALLVPLILLQGHCRDFYYIDDYQTTSYYQCFKQQGYSHITLYIEPYLPQFIRQQIQNMINAKSAGLELGVVLILSRSISPQEQVSIIVKNMGVDAIDQFWLLPDLNQKWSTYSPESNCLFFQEAIKILRETFGVSVGILSNKDLWMIVFGSQTYCSQMSDSPLWWLPSQQQQNYKPDFSNFQQFGGWKVPTMKFYSYSKQVCSFKEVYVSYYV